MNIFLDTETSGLVTESSPDRPKSEVLSITILDEDENVLLDTLVKPLRPIDPRASAVNGITYDMVKDAPTYAEISPKIREIVKGNTIFAYNMAFDEKFIPEIDDCEKGCMMVDFAEYNNSKWLKLGNACKLVGYELINAHNSKADTIGLIKIFKFLQKNKN